jgi:hypothetical protein
MPGTGLSQANRSSEPGASCQQPEDFLRSLTLAARRAVRIYLVALLETLLD